MKNSGTTASCRAARPFSPTDFKFNNTFNSRVYVNTENLQLEETSYVNKYFNKNMSMI